MSPKLWFLSAALPAALSAAVLALAAAAAPQTAGAAPKADERAAQERFDFELGPVDAIAPAAQPAAFQWTSFRIRNLMSGRRERIEIEPTAAAQLRGRLPDGCVFTRDADWFAPSSAWRRCGPSRNWRAATAVVRQQGDIWPLRVGAEASYERLATSSKTGDTSRRTTRCAVAETVAVRRSSGTVEPTYKVRCADGRRVRTTWWSPDSGLLFYRQVHERRGLEAFWERLPR